MAPDVLLRKLHYLRQLLSDLAPYENATLADVEAEHYKLERLLELLVATATDILFHKLAEMDVAPDSYRETFRLAGKHGLLPVDLAERMQNAAGMRNILVHLYEDIDYQILRDSIKPALQDFSQFTAILVEDLK
ncbi:MAG: DUF86 domain-containing protein [Caldilinea sp.]